MRGRGDALYQFLSNGISFNVKLIIPYLFAENRKPKPGETLAKVIFVILSEAKDLDSSVAYGSLRMTDM